MQTQLYKRSENVVLKNNYQTQEMSWNTDLYCFCWFTVAPMVLFQICDTSALIAYPCFQLMLSKDYAAPGSFLTLPPDWTHWGWARSREGTKSGQLISNDLRDIPTPCGIMLLSKSWGKKKESRTFGITAFVFPSNCCGWAMDPLLPGESNTPAGSGEWIYKFALITCTIKLFLNLLNCLYLDIPFLALLPFWFSAHPARLGGARMWGSNQKIVWV